MVAGLARGASEVCGRRPGATRLHASGWRMADSFSHREKVPRGADEGTERSLMPWMEAACWGCRHGRMPATERHLAHASGLRSRTLTPTRACGAGATRHARPWRASCASSHRRERGFGQLRHDRVQHFSKSRQQRAEAAAGPGIGGERHRDVPRRRVRQDVCRAEEPIPGRADALTEARGRRRTWRCLENPYPHPNSRAPARACGAGAPAVPPRPDGRGATRPPQERG
ncbi:hypothetical protein LMG19144_01368 [Xanthomonas arboricola pv. fragariae]|nr:hypothetical protein LMG19144_01368 [Xanthomonas arboricola pv. fragariae]